MQRHPLTLLADSISLEAETLVRTEPEAAERAYAEARAAARQAADRCGEDRQHPEVAAALDRLDRAGFARQRARQYPGHRFTLRLQFLRLGGTTLVAWPFEVLAEIGVRLKRRFRKPSSCRAPAATRATCRWRLITSGAGTRPTRFRRTSRPTRATACSRRPCAGWSATPERASIPRRSAFPRGPQIGIDRDTRKCDSRRDALPEKARARSFGSTG